MRLLRIVGLVGLMALVSNIGLWLPADDCHVVAVCILDANGAVVDVQIGSFSADDPRALAAVREISQYNYVTIGPRSTQAPHLIRLPVKIWFDANSRQWQARVMIPDIDPERTQRQRQIAGTQPVPVFLWSRPRQAGNSMIP